MADSANDIFRPEASGTESGGTLPPDPTGVPRWAKALVIFWGLLLLLPVPFLVLALCCAVIAVSHYGGPRLEETLGLFVAFAVGAVCGGGMFWHGVLSLSGKTSRPLRLPPVWALVGGFVVVMATALGLAQVPVAGALLAPPFILAAAALLPLAAVAWAVDNRPEGLTWRWAVGAFGAGATVSVLLALVLEFLIPYVVLWGLLDLGEPIRRALEEFTRLLAGREVARALTRPVFLIGMAQYAVVAPIVEEFTKSVVLLPLLWGRGEHRPVRSRREAFLLGTVAGAGFAIVENLVYALAGGWGSVLAVRALGAAIHPLGTGLTALTWYTLNPYPKWPRPPRWAAGFGLAVAQHGMWNGGILLWSALSGTSFFGIVEEVRVIGAGIAVGLLALLAVGGAAAAWGLRVISQGLAEEETRRRPLSLSLPEVPLERAVALWAVICLIVLLPLGLALLRSGWGR